MLCFTWHSGPTQGRGSVKGAGQLWGGGNYCWPCGGASEGRRLWLKCYPSCWLICTFPSVNVSHGSAAPLLRARATCLVFSGGASCHSATTCSNVTTRFTADAASLPATTTGVWHRSHGQSHQRPPPPKKNPPIKWGVDGSAERRVSWSHTYRSTWWRDGHILVQTHLRPAANRRPN